jgi:hypothetical protein
MVTRAEAIAPKHSARRPVSASPGWPRCSINWTVRGRIRRDGAGQVVGSAGLSTFPTLTGLGSTWTEDYSRTEVRTSRRPTRGLGRDGEFGGEGWESNPPRTPHSAPQTVLKTASLASAIVHQLPPEFGRESYESAAVRYWPPSSAGLAVILAVSVAASSPQPAQVAM